MTRGELLISCEDGCLQGGWQFGIQDGLARRQTTALQVGDVGGIEAGKQFPQAGRDSGVLDEIVLGRRGDGEAVRDPNALWRQFPEHLAQRGILAPDQWNIFDADVLEPENRGGITISGTHDCLLLLSAGRALRGYQGVIAFAGKCP